MASRKAPSIEVRLNGRADQRFLALSASRTTGGTRLDSCTLRVAHASAIAGDTQGHFTDFIPTASTPMNGEIEVSVGGNLIHWGVVDHISLGIGREEFVTITSRIQPWHFGETLRGMLEYPPQGELLTNDEHLIFNPTIDDKTEANKRSDSGAFIDPESRRTDAAKELHGVQTPELWNLQTATRYLCAACNRNQQYIQNPTDDDVAAVLPSTDSLLRDHRIRNGQFLPACLDDLLQPFGFSWYVELIAPGRRKIRVFKRGEGSQRRIALDPPGTRLSQSNAPQINLEANLGSVANEVQVLGDFRYVENTFTLIRAWPASKDDTARNKLATTSTEYLANSDLHRVHRDWVLNEAGDYIGIRGATGVSSGSQPAVTAPYDLEPTFGHPVVPRRRKFLPTLTLGADGSPVSDHAGATVEFSIDNGETWKPIAMLGCPVHLLDKECGIRFSGEHPPRQLISAGDSARVRITATLRDDQRLEYVAKSKESVLSVRAPVQIDMAKRFQYRKRIAGSKYDRDVSGGWTYTAIDDTQKIKAYGDAMRDTWNMAEVSGTVTLEGLVDANANFSGYELGSVLTNIVGRDIRLDAASTKQQESRHPQIIGITYDVQGQERRLEVQTFRDTIKGGLLL